MFFTEEEKATIAEQAKSYIEEGKPIDMISHLLFYPDNSSMEGVMGISTPITQEEHSKGGYVSKYYTLEFLSNIQKSIKV